LLAVASALSGRPIADVNAAYDNARGMGHASALLTLGAMAQGADIEGRKRLAAVIIAQMVFAAEDDDDTSTTTPLR